MPASVMVETLSPDSLQAAVNLYHGAVEWSGRISSGITRGLGFVFTSTFSFAGRKVQSGDLKNFKKVD